MRPVILMLLTLAGGQMDSVQEWMQDAFYPVLLLVLIAASLGVPIPEDIPLIAAGVLLRTHPGIASWAGTLTVALIGIMVGDLVLYSLGRAWGPNVVNHRSVNWMITRERFRRVARQFQLRGSWFCFFGRFVVGIRAAVCLTAGATHFPYWRFLLADLAGAVISVPAFVLLGYWSAGMIPTLRKYIGEVELIILALTLALLTAAVLVYRRRRRRPGLPVAPPSEQAASDTAPGPLPSRTPAQVVRHASPEVASAESTISSGV